MTESETKKMQATLALGFITHYIKYDAKFDNQGQYEDMQRYLGEIGEYVFLGCGKFVNLTEEMLIETHKMFENNEGG